MALAGGTGTRLKLRAEDAEDLAVIAACLQDAVIDASEMTYQPAERRFALAASRFRWEGREAAAGRRPGGDETGGGKTAGERVPCGLSFEHVTSVRHRGLEKAARAGYLELLTIAAEGNTVLLQFAGGGAVRLEVERFTAHFADLDEPWPTQWTPRHRLD